MAQNKVPPKSTYMLSDAEDQEEFLLLFQWIKQFTSCSTAPVFFVERPRYLNVID